MKIKEIIPEAASPGATSAGNIAAVANPHITNPYVYKSAKKKPKKVKPTKIKIQCYAETKKGTRCKFHITGMGCVLFCSRHQTCSKVCWS